jgi:hypothetical protein
VLLPGIGAAWAEFPHLAGHPTRRPLEILDGHVIGVRVPRFANEVDVNFHTPLKPCRILLAVEMNAASYQAGRMASKEFLGE